MSEIEIQLVEWAVTMADRDNLVRQAFAEGVSKRRIAQLTGLARMTVMTILDRTEVPTT